MKGVLAAAGATALLVACQASGPPPEAAVPVEPAATAEATPAAGGADEREPSGARAWRHMEALTEIGPRVYGTPGAEAARAYLRAQLEASGLTVEDLTTTVQLKMAGGPEGGVSRELNHLRVRLPGASPGVLMLLAHYDSVELTGDDAPTLVDANGSASGAALLLELARVFSVRERPYSLEFVFVDGEAGSTNLPLGAGSASLVFNLGEANELERIRTAFVLDQVADADLQIARDLRSERASRELIWREAARLGYDGAFPRNAEFRSPPSAHRAFLDKRFTRIVAIVDDSYGGSEAPGLYWNSEQDTLDRCSPESLEVVGKVVVGGIEALAARLARIDRFVRSPLSSLDEEAPLPPPSSDSSAGESAPAPPAPAPPAPAPPDGGADAEPGDPWTSGGGEAESGAEG